MDIELQEFFDARKRIESLVHKTELLYVNTFSKMANAEIYLKLENQQKTGSFKIRGASNKVAKMVEQGDKTPVIASSAGNHAQGVAHAAKLFDIKSTIVMPKSAPVAKIEATRGYGAEVVLYGDCYDDAYAKAVEIMNETGAKFLHPYDDEDVIVGQGTIGLEIMEQLPDADIVLVPAGGGGLLSGIACCIKKINPKTKVYGVQAENADAIARSFEAKKKVCTDSVNTIADGIAVKNPGDKTIELINKYVDGVIRVSDNDIASAILLLIERSKRVVEAAGATTLAAALNNYLDIKDKKVVCVLSGGNIDVALIGKLISKALLYRGRIAALYIVTSERPSDFNKAIKIINEMGGTIISVENADNFANDPKDKVFYVEFECSGQDSRNKILHELENNNIKIIIPENISKNIL